jgi:hypothetical protein
MRTVRPAARLMYFSEPVGSLLDWPNQNRENLVVLTDVLASKILWSSELCENSNNVTATGVEYVDAGGQVQTAVSTSYHHHRRLHSTAGRTENKERHRIGGCTTHPADPRAERCWRRDSASDVC